MNQKTVVIAIVIVTLSLLFGGTLLLSGNTSSAAIQQNSQAKVSVAETKFDWGDIDFKGGIKAKTFSIKNGGSAEVKLTNIKTSCHCTNAIVVINGVSSPAFGMSSKSNWVGTLPVGQEAQLIVTFDPAYHGVNGLGPVERLVAVETNDPSTSKLEFSIKGVVRK